jgi:hypothetical protein
MNPNAAAIARAIRRERRKGVRVTIG